jgi:uncharacterized protein (TIGR02466 family)
MEQISDLIYKYNIDVDSKYIQYAYDMKDNNPSVYKSNKGGWHSPNIVNDSAIRLLRWDIEDYVKAIDSSTTMNSIWININNYGHFNERHNHSNSKYSGVYYLSAEADQGDIVFDDSRTWDDSKATKYSVAPKSSVLMVFPSWLNHRVLPNNTFKDRISISFNFV